MFLGALSNTNDWWDEGKNWWLVGGATALGALFGGSLGHESDSWRWRTSGACSTSSDTVTSVRF